MDVHHTIHGSAPKREIKYSMITPPPPHRDTPALLTRVKNVLQPPFPALGAETGGNPDAYVERRSHQGAVTVAYLCPRYLAPGTHHTMCAGTRVGQASKYPAEILETVAQVGVSLN